MTRPTQLELTVPVAADLLSKVRTLEDENASLWVERNMLVDALDAARQQQERLEQELRRETRRADAWQHLAFAWGEPPSQGPNLDKAALTKLLTLCHPDKWSQGQPATELAHEITVVVNQLRTRIEEHTL